MKVVVLSPYPETLAATLKASGDKMVPLDDTEAAWLVSYGWGKMVPGTVLERFPRRAVNLHISMLPWNRGADPNLWSWVDDTPKGATLHLMTGKLDGGDIIAQQPINWRLSDRVTLASTYADLRTAAEGLFAYAWPRIRHGRFTAHPQAPGGSYHRAADKESVPLPAGWATPVTQLCRQAA
jgi:methionyl-tRNA formyltransferase